MTAVSGAEAFRARMMATDRQMEDLERFRSLLHDWNATMNLVGPSALREFWPRHAFDSAQLLHVEHHAHTWADLGAGAGFPGVVLAILLKGRSPGHVHLVESLAKRVGFLKHVCETLGLPVTIHHGRAESLREVPRVGVVTARACAPMAHLLYYAKPFLDQGATGLFLKGGRVETELAEASRLWKFQAELLPSASDPTGRIVRIESLTRA